MDETQDYQRSGAAAIHATTHQLGGSDQITVQGLSGVLAENQPSSWALITGKPSTFTPAAHASSHQNEGADEISVAGLSGVLADLQAADTLDTYHATAFPLLLGRSGGQTLIGGTASGDNLTLQSTSHATKGKILLGSASAYDEANSRLGLKTTSPSTALQINAANDTDGLTVYGYDDHSTDYGHVYVDASGYFRMEASDSHGIRYSALGDRIIDFQTNSSSRMQITSTGSLFIGGANYLLMNSDGTYYIARISLNTQADARRGIVIRAYSATQSADLLQTQNSAGTALTVITATGKLGINQATPTISGTGNLHMTADTMRLDTARTPASAAAAGNAGEICWDADYIYVCTATNTWKRATIATW